MASMPPAGRGRPKHLVAWLSIDRGDNDPARFLTYLIAALQTVEPGIGRSILPLLHAPGSPSLQDLITLLVNEISALGNPIPIALALDDYHLIESVQIHAALAFLIDHLPPALRLIISTRFDPPLPLARLRAGNQLAEIRAGDLRFTFKETENFLNQTMGLKLEEKEITILEQQTEGWIAGLQLAALSIQGLKNPIEFISGFSGQNNHIMDYLFQEVFSRQAPTIQSFLLETSILNRFCESLCEAVMVKAEAATDQNLQQFFRELDQSDLFIISLDHERHWYRYHHLFQEFLRFQLENYHAALVPELNHRASLWYESQGLVLEAIDHAFSATEYERAAHLIDQSAEIWIAHGEITTLLEKLAGLPEAITRSSASLCIWKAWALTLSRQTEEVEPWLQCAGDYFLKCKRQAEQDEENRANLLWNYQAGYGQVLAIQATIAQQQKDSKAAITLAEQALELLPRNDLVLPSAMELTLGEAYLSQNDAATASVFLTQAIQDSRAAQHAYIHIFALMEQAKAQVLLGDLSRTREFYEMAMRYGRDNELEPLSQIASKALVDTGLFQPGNPTHLTDPLNSREIEIISLIATGLSNQEIADQLVIAVSTVRWYVKRIYRKLNVHNRTQAAYKARSLGFL
jgi:LuxR family maltose regulon positive regulatory protein